MKENTDTDNRTRNLLTDSRLVLNNPAFMSRVMQQIERESAAQTNRRFYLKWTFIILTAELFIGLTIWSVGGQFSSLSELSYQVISTLELVLVWVLNHHYFFVPFLILLLVRAIIESRSRVESK